MNILLDTDIGCDCDDAGALALLHALAAETGDTLLAVSCSSPGDAPVLLTERINRFYGVEVPVGRLEKKLPLGLYKDVYAEALTVDEPPGPRPGAVPVLRRALAQAADGSVVFIGIGGQSNLRELMLSLPDTVSPMSGAALLEAKLLRTVLMAGRFVDATPEWNVLCDIEAARAVAAGWPGDVTYCGHEVGESLVTGGVFFDDAMSIRYPDHPVAQAYVLHGGPRYSWDPAAVLAAMRPEEWFPAGDWGDVTVAADGVTAWHPGPGRRRILRPAERSDVEKTIDRLLLYRCDTLA